MASAAWWPFGQNGKNSVTNDPSALSEPVPRTSPRLFRDQTDKKTITAQPVKGKKTAHQHSPGCNCSKPNVSTNAAGGKPKSFYDRSEAELQKVIQSAEAGNMKSAYLMWQYYERHQEAAKAAQWREKTRQLAEKAPSADAFAQRVSQKLSKLEAGSNPYNR
jgi:hypothetical protein